MKGFFDGFNDKFGLLAKEIDSLRKERDELREKVELQAKEILDLRQNSICQRCRMVSDKVLKVDHTHTLTHEKPIWCVKFSPDGKYLVTACNDGKVRVYDVKTGSIVRVLTDLLTKDPWIRCLCFSPDGKRLATGSNDSLIRIWKIAERHVRNAFKGHKKRITSLEFSPNGKLLVSASRDNSIRIWNMHDGAARVFTSEARVVDRDSSFYSATFSPSGMHVAAGHSDGAIRIWDLLAGQLVHKLTGHQLWVACVAFMPDGAGLVTGGGDGAMRYWDLSPLEIFRPFGRGPRYASDRRNYQAKRGSPAEIQPGVSKQFSGHTSNVTSIAMLPTGRWFASSSSDQTVRIWDTHDATLRCVLEAHKKWVWSVDLSPVGNHLASGDTDGTVRVWSYYES